MKDEIKEILDNVKLCCDITKDQSFTVYQRQDILALLDCITNLQEENKRLYNYYYKLQVIIDENIFKAENYLIENKNINDDLMQGRLGALRFVKDKINEILQGSDKDE